MFAPGQTPKNTKRRRFVFKFFFCFAVSYLRRFLYFFLFHFFQPFFISFLMDNFEQVEEVDEVGELQDLQGADLEENNEELVVENVVAPTVGMSFDSPDEMFEYYKTYGLQEGFPVMRRSCRKGDDGSLRYVTFTCGRNGKSKAKATNVLQLQPNQKIGCNAKIGGRLDIVSGKWVIGNLILEHNHAVSPSKSRYYRCNRFISPFVKKQLEINEEAGIKMAQSFKSIVVEAGDFENVSFLERDARNHVDKVRRLRLGEGDAIAIQSIDLDEECRLKNVFWADPRSRAAYKDFGDVVTFDTTYLTNKYDMPFAPFVGVNHHGQSILLGCGLISHEDTETFTWLFDTWLSCMSWCPPLGIITDQDKAMKKAIQIKYEKAMESKIEKEWQADARSFSQRLPFRTSFAMPYQFCHGKASEIRCVCSMFEYKGILCKHAIAVLSRNRVQLLPEKYILRRWRKDVWRFSSKVKVSYDARSSSIEHQRYREECTAFYDVAEVASKNEESHKNIMGWIEKAMKDVSLNVRCDGDDTTIDGGSSSNIQDPVVSQRKSRPPSQRKQKQFKRPKQKSNNVSINTTIERAIWLW
ncbi:protein FAR1-RELATED SEQUENCE [Citrus sinensis]|nr:protein FAR1-RELATED SEQUENCE [Citrus sinensis]